MPGAAQETNCFQRLTPNPTRDMSNSKKTQNLTVTIIGAGRLGTALALALTAKRYQVLTLVAKHQKSANRAASKLDVPARPLAVKQIKKLPLTDLLIVSTPDDQIADVADALLSVDPLSNRKCVVLHTSGALSSAALAPLSKRGWQIGSAHPLVSVSNAEVGASSLRHAFWSVEGDAAAVRVARRLVRDLEGHSFEVDSKDKPLYHAAALMTAGSVVALFDVALEMMTESGLSRKDARRILQPLLRSAVDSLETRDTAEALTGTFSRGDIKTVRRHLESLNSKGVRLKDARQLYETLGLRSLVLAKRNGLDPKVAKQIESLLK
jgi:predicted short-subunit dehydrogenase-like oxidoreductase (DUF2520 family)